MKLVSNRRGSFSLEMTLAILVAVTFIGGCFNLARYLLATASVHSALVEVARCMRSAASDCNRAGTSSAEIEDRALAVVRRSFPLVTAACGPTPPRSGVTCLALRANRNEDAQSVVLRLEVPLLFPLDVLLADHHITVGAAARMTLRTSDDSFSGEPQ
ncbi:MAG: hypothetical protein IT290_00240 [Deltaproteobacteria bacterium]|nr:hypothetical protein [Deltaproteobacteria bacterium]